MNKTPPRMATSANYVGAHNRATGVLSGATSNTMQFGYIRQMGLIGKLGRADNWEPQRRDPSCQLCVKVLADFASKLWLTLSSDNSDAGAEEASPQSMLVNNISATSSRAAALKL